MTRVGLAGYGMAGRQIHAPLLAAAGLEIAAVSTSNPERQAAVQEDHPGGGRHRPRGLLQVEGLDLIVLATPSGDHAAHALTVIEAGIALVVDKPLAVSADAALEVVDAAEQAGVPPTASRTGASTLSTPRLAEIVVRSTRSGTYRAELRWERWRPEPKQRWREQADP